ncbi:MAG: hypothetical protein HZB21_02635 [Deltaproteobacteria bacterium]|nr:hypothetical protein [Deltaproteobacteria bacterium]
MKIYKLPNLAESSPEGVYSLGEDELKASSVYLTYGRLLPKETGRKVLPHDGYEEIIYIVKGSVRVNHGKGGAFTLGAGEAFGPKGACSLDNLSDAEAAYIAAGGRTGDAPADEARRAPLDAASPAGKAAHGIAKVPLFSKEGAGEIIEPSPAVKKAVPEEEEFEITREDTPEAEEDKG